MEPYTCLALYFQYEFYQFISGVCHIFVCPVGLYSDSWLAMGYPIIQTKFTYILLMIKNV